MRCSPSVENQALVTFDKQLRAAVGSLTNCDVSDEQWLQATLPVRLGGLGIRRVSSLVLPAFLASAASTLQLQTTILAQTSSSAEDSIFAAYLEQWRSASDTALPSDMLPVKQSFRGRPGIIRTDSKSRPRGSTLNRKHDYWQRRRRTVVIGYSRFQ